jgi:hypothetical protein
VHNLHVELDPASAWLAATDTVALLAPGTEWVFGLDARLDLVKARSGDTEWTADDVAMDADSTPTYRLGPLPETEDTVRVALQFAGALLSDGSDEEFSHHFHTPGISGVITKEGAFLGEGCVWFPRGDGPMCGFNLTVVTPAGWEAVSEGVRTERIPQGDTVVTTWRGDFPVEAVTLVAGPYQIAERRFGDRTLYGFFYGADVDLIQEYFQYAAGRLALYEGMLGPYPYQKFAVVENFLPTGYAMPSFTLLGRRVLRLPFITRISLGHEILHNWWGNGVYVAERSGNWCEGLTTYLADYWYEEQEGEGPARQYRRQILLDYANYVGESDELPLRDFRYRTTPATRSVGYGKAAMVFHMLRQIVGDDVFFAALRDFYRESLWREATWADLARAFGARSGSDLSWFFRQWIDRSGAPIVEIGDVAAAHDTVVLRLVQRGEPYRLLLSLGVVGQEDTLQQHVWLAASDSTYAFGGVASPRSVLVDEGIDVFRLLHSSEVPPLLGAVVGDSGSSVITMQEESAPGAERAASMGQSVVVLEAPPQVGVPSPSFIIGMPTAAWMETISELCPTGVTVEVDGFTLLDHRGTWEQDALVVAVDSPARSDGRVVLVLGRPEITAGVTGRLQHYGKYSYLLFHRGSVTVKGQWEVTSSPLRRFLNQAERSFSG